MKFTAAFVVASTIAAGNAFAGDLPCAYLRSHPVLPSLCPAVH